MPAIDRERWRELAPFLNEVLELTGPERAAWIALMRERSAETADEIIALLSEDEAHDARGFLSNGPSPDTHAPLAGSAIGAYRLERPLGAGGMGTVWLATRADGRFEGKVAIKFLNRSLLTPQGQERFRREGSLLARLRHPGVAQLLDAGVNAQGQPYLVLEHIDGERIDRYVTARALPIRARIELVLQLLDAVGHAHANLVVHRDLKPSNILVTARGVVKLLDFGIAKLVDASELEGGAALTMDGGRVMTPEYAAPEQLRGDVVTTGADVYAAGVLLYLLLSGRHPTLHSSSVGAAHALDRFDRHPPCLALGDLDVIVQRALKASPAERYPSIDAFADDLRRYLRREPISARADSLPYRIRRFVARNRVTVGAGTLAAASLVTATIVSALQMRDARQQRDAAIAERTRADAQVEFQGLLMSTVGERAMTLRQLLDASRDMLERTYQGDNRTLVDLLLQLSTSYSALGEQQERARLVRWADSLARASGDPAQRGETSCHLGDVARHNGDLDGARRFMDAGDALVAGTADDAAAIACGELRAPLELEAGDADAGERAAQRVLTLLAQGGKAKSRKSAEMLDLVAQAQSARGEARRAVTTYQQAIALADSTGWGETLVGASLRHNAALSIGKLGETAESERLLSDLLTRVARQDSSGRVHVQILVHAGQMALAQGHDAVAARYFAMLERRAVADDNPYWQARGSFGLAQAQLHLGDIATARATIVRFDEARARVARLGTDDQIVFREILDGELALLTGHPDSAVTLLRDGLAKGGHPERASRRQHTALMLAARAAIAADRPSEALAFAERAIETASLDALTATRSRYVGEGRLLAGLARLALLDTASARADFEAATTALSAGGGPDHPLAIESADRLARLRR